MSTHFGVRLVAFVANRLQAVAVLGGLLLLAPLAASAAIITVNSTADTSSARFCTLRDAITAANTDTATGGCAAGSGDDTIQFSLVLPAVKKSPATIKLTSGLELAISTNVTILGPGATSLAIDGNKSTRVFHITAGATTISGLTVKNANGGTGGGILSEVGGTLAISNCTLDRNLAQGSNSHGGGIYNDGTLTMTNCTLSGNSVSGSFSSGGGIYNTGTATLTYCTLNGNRVTGVTGGGGISNNGGTLTMTNCTLSDNSDAGGGGIGGGIFSGGTLTMTNCTLSGNSLSGGGNSMGGGIYNGGTATLTNCTLSGNSNLGGALGGGGIFNAYTSLTLTNCTLSGNRVTGGGGGGGIVNWSGALTIANTIIAGSQSAGGDCASVGGGATVTDNGHNLIQDSTNDCGLTGPTDIVGLNPKLKKLANNGGATMTMALSTVSPAVDAGDNTLCSAADQRGLLRISGTDTICDIGAYEAP